MPYNILPGAFPETQYIAQAPTQNLAFSALADAPAIINATFGWAGGTGSAIGTAYAYTFDATANGGNPLAVNGAYAIEWVVPGTALALTCPTLNYGGTYTLTIRCRSTIGPQAGATLVVSVSNATNQPNPFTYSNTFNIGSLGNTYQTFTWVIPQVLYNNQSNWSGFTVSFAAGSGYSGLLLDYIELTQNTVLTDAQQIANQNLTTWTTAAPGPVTTSPAIWHGAAIYHDYWGIETAAAGIAGATVAEGTWFSNNNTRGFNANALSSPAVMVGYQILVLDNLDALTFGWDQRNWLAGYVNAGGRVLMLGGVYSCGSGFWQQSDAASPIFPCTFSSYDLHPATQTFQLVPGGIYSGTLSSPPVSLWQHTLVPRAGAITQATVGGNPAIVTWTLGTGKVAVVGLTPHGVVGANSVWWNDSRWAGSVIEPLLNWLLTPNPPNNIGLPSIAGFAVKGQTLTCSTGSWGGSPSSYTYQWVNSLTGNVGTGSTYVLQASDVGARMTCIVTAINTYGSATATSSSTGIVVNAAVTTTVTIASTIARAPVASTPIG